MCHPVTKGQILPLATRLWGMPAFWAAALCWSQLSMGSQHRWSSRWLGGSEMCDICGKGVRARIQNTGSDEALWLFQHLGREYLEIMEATLFAVPKGQGPVIILTAHWDRCLILSSWIIPLTTVRLFFSLDTCLSAFLSLISSDQSLKWWH